MNNIIKIKAFKYPNVLHYEWEGELLEKTSDYVIVLCKYGRKLIHYTKNDVYTLNNTSIEYFSLNEWFTVATEVEKGIITSNYCNVAMPSVLVGNEIQFVDLDLDLIKKLNGNWEVVDEDEFESNSIKYNYPVELKNEALKALDNLKLKVKKGNFPFNKDIISFIN